MNESKIPKSHTHLLFTSPRKKNKKKFERKKQNLEILVKNQKNKGLEEKQGQTFAYPTWKKIGVMKND